MGIIRAILVTLVAVSVAMLPVAGTMAQITLQGASHIASQSDCCSQGKPCDKQPNKCGDIAGCTLKCAGVSALPLAPTGVAFSPSASTQSSALTGIATTRSSTPPSPPPRA
jgi:hypothetical protein